MWMYDMTHIFGPVSAPRRAFRLPLYCQQSSARAFCRRHAHTATRDAAAKLADIAHTQDTKAWVVSVVPREHCKAASYSTCAFQRKESMKQHNAMRPS